MMLEPIRKNERLSASKQNRLIQITNNINAPGAVGISQYGSSGVAFLDHSELDIRIFEMIEDMQFGADNTLAPHATTHEVLIKHGGDPDEYVAFRPEIEVYHPLSPRDSSGNYIDEPAGFPVTGARIVAWFNEQSSRWEIIVSVGVPTARHIEFTLGKALATTDANVDTVTVDAVYEGTVPAGTITVYNKSESGGDYIFEGDIGDEGMAVWDGVRGNYRIWQMECP